MTDTTRIERIIRALIAKANGTDNADEAAIFMAKAHALLEEHQLDMGATLNADDPIEHFEGLDQAATSHKWNRELYRALGALYGCKSFRNTYYAKNADGTFKYNAKGGFELRYQTILTGRASAIMTTQLMYPWVCDQVKAHAKEIAKRTGMSEQGQAKRVGAALVTRIWQMVLEQRKNDKAPKTAGERNALATIDLVEAAFKERHPDAVTAKTRSTLSDALSREAAGKIGLHQQAGHSSALRLGSS